ncbi:Retrovirus-related Pol polyprotein from transposon RE1 [Vitis vinifera]|uniref:Retrovirus-related Pol polyprotein from transposon RE1 n=1 Tax=Vitis vinifera TaxID=29760 RepID=A0A438FNB8_VITVI|nr:Retrovirus-related Pol polyprotein from transposon RE1 [Vitis vinifera]
MMEDNPCESFEPLDLPHVSTHGDEEPESSESITPKSPNFTTKPVSSPIPASITRNFPQFPKCIQGKRSFQNKSRSKNPTQTLGMKSRLVAKGYTQTYGVDYQETFAPVAKMNTVRILLTLAAYYNWQLLQYDVKNAFLHGDLDEEIYMNIPPRFEGNTSNKVCKLKKAFYGIKQSPRAWFGRFAKVMKESRYKQSQGDHTLFIKHSAAGGVTTFLVYVDNIIVIGNYEREKHEVKQVLATEFEIKELGKLKYFLGIEVAYSIQRIFISQQKYVTNLLAETGKIGCKPISTPMDPNHKLREAQEEPMVDKRMYQRLVGRLIYLAHTRPNIAYSMSVISQFMHDPREPHLQVAYRVLHYLKGNPEKGILFKKNNTLALEAYTDTDASSLVDRRSTTGYYTFLGDDLRIKWDGPMKLYCDNKSAINIAHNPIQHDRTKHIEIDRHFIKEKLEEGVVRMSYVPSEHQLVDILTKGLNSSMFHNLVFKL